MYNDCYMQVSTFLEFTESMLNLQARMGLELGQPSPRLLRMIRKEGGLRTAVTIVRRKEPSSRFYLLHNQGRLDLSVEAWILQPQWSHLFSTSTKIVAYRRLMEFGYFPPSPSWNPWYLFKTWTDQELPLAA